MADRPASETSEIRGREVGEEQAPLTRSGAISQPHFVPVTVLAPQISKFGGTESESVELWIQRVDNIARIHRASSDAVLLAATSKLVGAARKWYDIQTGAALKSWPALKHELSTMFHRRIPFYAVMRKTEERKWASGRETFRQYALDKLALMYSLNLPTADQINLLIGGIMNASIRATALSSKFDSIDCLEVMRHVTEGVMELEPRNPAPSRGSTGRDPTVCRNCGKRGHRHKECRNTEVTCFYCKGKGHRSFDCPQLKKRRRLQSQSAYTPPSTRAAPAGGQTIAAVEEATDRLIVDDVLLNVVTINDRKCDLRALGYR